LWAHPDDKSTNFNDVKHWVKLAQLLEAANFHGIFIADVLVSSACLSTESLIPSRRPLTTSAHTGRVRRLQRQSRPRDHLGRPVAGE
jgi:alkanesulfonate monooxygenase SsuD/methylene tetrahydromethanopterin reductase-like flavin-dependent oxidoreductase (luciferase family)